MSRFKDEHQRKNSILLVLAEEPMEMFSVPDIMKRVPWRANHTTMHRMIKDMCKASLVRAFKGEGLTKPRSWYQITDKGIEAVDGYTKHTPPPEPELREFTIDVTEAGNLAELLASPEIQVLNIVSKIGESDCWGVTIRPVR